MQTLIHLWNKLKGLGYFSMDYWLLLPLAWHVLKKSHLIEKKSHTHVQPISAFGILIPSKWFIHSPSQNYRASTISSVMAGFSEIAELVVLSAAGANKKLPLAFWIEIWNSSVNSHRLKARWAASVLSFLAKLTNASMENREEFKSSFERVCRGGSPCFHDSKCVRRTTTMPTPSSSSSPSSLFEFKVP